MQIKKKYPKQSDPKNWSQKTGAKLVGYPSLYFALSLFPLGSSGLKDLLRFIHVKIILG